MNNVFKWKITQFTFIHNNFKQKHNKYAKNSHKMSVVYSKGGAVHFDLRFLVRKAFNVIIWISRRKKNRLWFSDISELEARIVGNLCTA